MGGCRCTFRTCNVSTLKFPHMSFFHYPVVKKDRLEKWIRYSKYNCIKSMPVSQARNRSVCGLHFKDECFMNYKKNRLTPWAVPCIDRLKSGKVLDYSLADNPMPTMMPPTKGDHLIPPPGVFIWGHEPEFWNSYSTVNIVRPKRERSVNECILDPSSKKPKILNKGIDLLSIVSLDENFVLDETTTISMINDDYPQSDQDEDNTNVLDDTSSIDLPEARTSQATIRTISEVSSAVDDIDNMNDVEFFTPDPNESTEEMVPKKILETACLSYEEEIAELKKQMKVQEVDALKVFADLKAELEETKKKLQQSGNIATTLKSKVTECEMKMVDLQTKNEELVKAKAAEPLPVTPKPASSSSLSKPQLFNGIKKYLSASMTALVRMEMFGNSERSWKPDEKQVCVELLKLGEDVYNYFRDEWRFRLPPKKMVEEWMDEVAEDDIDDL